MANTEGGELGGLSVEPLTGSEAPSAPLAALGHHQRPVLDDDDDDPYGMGNPNLADTKRTLREHGIRQPGFCYGNTTR